MNTPSLPDSVDVLIAGGGPSGLFLALDLAQRGISAHVLEPRVEIDWTRPRAKTTNARTMTHLRRLGLADRLRDASPLSVDYSEDVIFCTSLDGYELTRFRHAFQLHTSRYDAAPECGQQVAQPVVEQVLRDAVVERELAHLHLGWSFDSADGGLARVVHTDGSTREVHYRYLIGADGVSSAVRRNLGIRLEGSSASKSNLGVVFRSEKLEDHVALDPAVQYWVVGNTYAGMVGALDRDGLWWAIIQGYDAQAPHFRDVPTDRVVRSLIGVDADKHIDIEVVAEDPWTARMLLSPTYRDGDVFLVGDAAHANPPWGGHGFNTCIGDAANLAWKLAAVLHGWAGPDLLTTYGAERRPVARRTIDEAVANGSTLADDLLGSDLTADTAEGAKSRAAAADRLAVKESEFSSLGLVLGYHYGDSELITPAGSAPPAAHPIRYEPTASPGCLLPHAWLSDGRSLYDVLGADYTVLVAPGSSDEGLGTVDLDAVSDVAAATAVPSVVRQLTPEDADVARTWEASIVLVRPDQHVAWRGDTVENLLLALRAAAGMSVTALVH